MSNSIQTRIIPNRYASTLMLAIGMAVVHAISVFYWLYLMASCGFSVRRFRKLLAQD